MSKKKIKPSFTLAGFDEDTFKHLSAIYHCSFNKWFAGDMEDKPTKLGIVSLLINDLWALMVAEGEIHG